MPKGRRSSARASSNSKVQVRYEISVRHDALGKQRVISGTDHALVDQQAQMLAAQWNAEAERKEEAERKRAEREAIVQAIELRKKQAEQLTNSAQAALGELDNLLVDFLGTVTPANWDSLKDHSNYAVKCPVQPDPLPPSMSEPQRSDGKYQIRRDLLDLLSPERFAAKQELADAAFQRDHAEWEETERAQAAAAEAQRSEHAARVQAWQRARYDFLCKQAAKNEAVERHRAAYKRGDNPEAVARYCALILSQSRYPKSFPKSFALRYLPDSRMLVVDYEVPNRDDLPTVCEVRYVQSRDALEEKTILQTVHAQTYDGVLYQIALRTLHEMFVTDQANALSAVVFNGYVQTTDPATGQNIRPYVMSVQVGKEEFAKVDLSRVDPKACFRSLKGVAAARLSTQTPIRPLLRMNREDPRFVDGQPVVEELDDSSNLAAMHWEDFEHLIRELFEKEFATEGSEVKVTRASRDGGVDAVVFDPDPIRGGKIVIQAKRYTHTVGVGFVRDLYGTVLNEGANKGILVTTSSYGADAYGFAKDKPLVLLNGSELLYLLEKHGHKARIDLDEARHLLAPD